MCPCRTGWEYISPAEIAPEREKEVKLTEEGFTEAQDSPLLGSWVCSIGGRFLMVENERERVKHRERRMREKELGKELVHSNQVVNI